MSAALSCTCPNCGHQFEPAAHDPGARVRELEAACRARGYMVTPDGRVREEVAAELLGLAPKTLQNWAYGDGRLPITRVARRRTYRLSDLAEMLEAAK